MTQLVVKAEGQSAALLRSVDLGIPSGGFPIVGATVRAMLETAGKASLTEIGVEALKSLKPEQIQGLVPETRRKKPVDRQAAAQLTHQVLQNLDEAKLQALDILSNHSEKGPYGPLIQWIGRDSDPVEHAQQQLSNANGGLACQTYKAPSKKVKAPEVKSMDLSALFGQPKAEPKPVEIGPQKALEARIDSLEAKIDAIFNAIPK